MRPFTTLATLGLVGCAVGTRSLPSQPTPVWVRSHNKSPVDVYLLCGSNNARWLGSVSEKGSEDFEIPARQLRCAVGLNFFLVVQNANRGYWVGPFSANQGDMVTLVIEKYAGLSSAQVRYAGL